MLRTLRLVLVFALAITVNAAFASTSGIVISQVYGGGGNTGATYKNDFIEIFNAGSAAVDVTGWTVQYASATGSSWSTTALGNKTIAPGQYFLIQESTGASGTVNLPAPDATGSLALSATAGKVALVNNATALNSAMPTNASIVDLVGFGTTAGYYEGTGPTPAPSNTTGVLRVMSGCTDTDNNSTDFVAGTPAPRNTSTALHPCGATTSAPIVTSCPSFTVVAGSGGTSVVTATDADGTVNAATLSGQPAGITLGPVTPASGPGGTASAPIVVSATVGTGSFPVTVTWGNDQSQSAVCTPIVTVGALTPIYSIQGSGNTSPLLGRSVITQGVVTRVNRNGFFLQDPVGDGDPTTSDGIFAFTPTAPAVSIGNLVRVSGMVTEFNAGGTGNPDTTAHTVTELSSVGSISLIGDGYAITPVTIQFPMTTRAALEAYEGMLVTLNGPFTVVENAYQAQYGEVTVAALGRVETPTNRYRPGASAQALQIDNQNRSIVFQDGSSGTNASVTPFLGSDNTLREGDTFTGVTGVLTYGLAETSSDPGSWVVVPIVDPLPTRANPRTTMPDEVGGSVRIGSANIDNYFTTFTNGQTADGRTGQGCTLGSSTSAGNCRGADNLTEYTRQVTKIVEELAGINGDVVALMEVQNNGSTAIQTLVDTLNARVGAGTYAAVPDPAQGTGTDAIKVAMIYKPAKLTLVGTSASDPNPIHNRPPMAQTFLVPGGQTFTVVANHLKAKGCSASATGLDADQGDLQSCFNFTRVQQAAATQTFVSSLFPSGPLPNVILVGDFNSYAMEDPIYALTSNGFVDELGRFNTFGYSYGFGGSSGRLDQALTSPAMSAKVQRAIEWHINADEPVFVDYNLEFKQPACGTCAPDYYSPTPYRASDHDPIVIGVSLGSAPPVTPPKRGK